MYSSSSAMAPDVLALIYYVLGTEPTRLGWVGLRHGHKYVWDHVATAMAHSPRPRQTRNSN